MLISLYADKSSKNWTSIMTHCIKNSQQRLLVVKAMYSNVSDPLVILDRQQHLGKTAAMLQKVAPYRCPFSPMLTISNATTYQ